MSLLGMVLAVITGPIDNECKYTVWLTNVGEATFTTGKDKNTVCQYFHTKNNWNILPFSFLQFYVIIL